MSTFQRLRRFSQIPAQLNYPPRFAAKLSMIHSMLIDIVIAQHSWARSDLQKIIRIMNTATYRILDGDSYELDTDDVLSNPCEDDMTVRSLLDSPKYHLYIEFRDIHWASDDIEIIYPAAPDAEGVPKLSDTPKHIDDTHSHTEPGTLTPKDDLYINPPAVPRFDIKQVYASALIGDTAYCVYKSLPQVPKRQVDISITTDASVMTSAELLKLFPNCRIHTRAACMYESCPGLKLHPILGLILPIGDFTYEQLVDNIVRYPHLYKLTRVVDDRVVSFYTDIEIDGDIVDIKSVWSQLPDTKKIPYNADFIKEYVVRRYLLERDILKINHKYPLLGTLDPFLTLFTTPAEYESLGYVDAVQLARSCVNARVSYKASRNPVMRRLKAGV